MTRRRDRGSASIWVVACAALLMVLAGVAVVRAAAVLARHRAEAAADLAALAAAGRLGTGAAPCAWAARIATGNGATLQSCRVRPAADGRAGIVDVAVRLPVRLPVAGRQVIVARARAGRLECPAAAACALRGGGDGRTGVFPAGLRWAVWERPPCGMLARGSPCGRSVLESAGRRRTGR